MEKKTKPNLKLSQKMAHKLSKTMDDACRDKWWCGVARSRSPRGSVLSTM